MDLHNYTLDVVGSTNSEQPGLPMCSSEAEGDTEIETKDADVEAPNCVPIEVDRISEDVTSLENTKHLFSTKRKGGRMQYALYLYRPCSFDDSFCLEGESIEYPGDENVGYKEYTRLNSSFASSGKERIPFDAKLVFGHVKKIVDGVVQIVVKFGTVARSDLVSSWDCLIIPGKKFQKPLKKNISKIKSDFIEDFPLSLREELSKMTEDCVDTYLVSMYRDFTCALRQYGMEVVVDVMKRKVLKVFTKSDRVKPTFILFTDPPDRNPTPLFDKLSQFDIASPENEIDFRFQVLQQPKQGEFDHPLSAETFGVKKQWDGDHLSFVWEKKEEKDDKVDNDPHFVSYSEQLQMDVNDHLASSRVYISIVWTTDMNCNDIFERDGGWIVEMSHSPKIQVRVEGEAESRDRHLDLAKHVSNVSSILGVHLGQESSLTRLY